jgi:FAD/FMN-containing dehydrogenase
MNRAREILHETKTEVIYGTLRLIQPDATSFLKWARERFICTIFNLRTPHTESGIARTRETFRLLSQASVSLGGSFFLTYHRYADSAVMERAYPNIRAFFAAKKRFDPQERFQSNWYRHYRAAFGHA